MDYFFPFGLTNVSLLQIWIMYHIFGQGQGIMHGSNTNVTWDIDLLGLLLGFWSPWYWYLLNHMS